MYTTFWHLDGISMTAQQFIEMLFDKVPEFFKDEAELRAVWSALGTHKSFCRGSQNKALAVSSWPKYRGVSQYVSKTLNIIREPTCTLHDRLLVLFVS
ncbi:MAG: hypothetical protein KDE53_07650 [Caldilineaceae bacterium]|nr:hypothetical protein [Caldilineaceae bacterium]